MAQMGSELLEYMKMSTWNALRLNFRPTSDRLQGQKQQKTALQQIHHFYHQYDQHDRCHHHSHHDEGLSPPSSPFQSF